MFQWLLIFIFHKTFDIIEHDFLARVFTSERDVCILGINIPRMANISALSR